MAVIGGQRQGNQRCPKKRLKALAEFVLGEGQQPKASLISVVCEAFNCTPTEAVKQDPALVREILEVRLIESAKDQHNEDVTKMTDAQTKLWFEAMEALNG